MIFILLVCCSKLFSQSFTAGVIAGISNTEISGLDVYDADNDFNRLGVVFGGFVNRSFGERISLQMELLYTTKGTYQPPPDSNSYFSYRYRLNYIEIPILFKYKMHLLVNKEELDKLEVEAGPSYAQLISSLYTDNAGLSVSDLGFNKSDFLINIGLTYYFTEDFLLDLCYSNSIVPIAPVDGNVGYSYYSIKGHYNMAFNYTLRYIFR